MTFTEEAEKLKESDIIKAFVADNLGASASAEAVAKWLNAGVPPKSKYEITRATAYNWTADVHDAGWHYIIVYTMVYPQDDPRHQMAQAIWNFRVADVREFLQEQVPA